jgi:hypothetical protein
MGATAGSSSSVCVPVITLSLLDEPAMAHESNSNIFQRAARFMFCPRQRIVFVFAWSAFALAPALAAAIAQEVRSTTPEARAVAYLAVEVPKWTAEHACLSCHNNGDAARALMAAAALGELPDRKPLAATLKFLAAPNEWDANGPDGPFKDPKLARIQFAAALTQANDTRVSIDKRALQQAAPLVAELQDADGSWETDVGGNIGSPVTYGRHLATSLASRTLRAADPAKYQTALAKAQDWLRQAPVNNVLNAAATLWALTDDSSAEARAARERCLPLIRQGQTTDGGWGPYVKSQPEAFDTALVVLALAAQKDSDKYAPLVRRGRAYLIATQSPDGSWPATTRPAGADSYAQQLSTTGWATMALLATRPNANK